MIKVSWKGNTGKGWHKIHSIDDFFICSLIIVLMKFQESVCCRTHSHEYLQGSTLNVFCFFSTNNYSQDLLLKKLSKSSTRLLLHAKTLVLHASDFSSVFFKYLLSFFFFNFDLGKNICFQKHSALSLFYLNLMIFNDSSWRAKALK